jgi:Holliday junction DNA helicase RuvB
MSPEPAPSPANLSEFVGQNRLKARLQLAIAAAKSRGEPLGHTLLLGPEGLGKAAFAQLIAGAMGVGLKSASAQALVAPGDLAGLLTNLEDNDVLLLEDIYQLKRTLGDYLLPAATKFKLDVTIDDEGKVRSVRLNLPFFTLIGTAPRRERLPRYLLSCFSIVESLDPYSDDELSSIARFFAVALHLPLDTVAAPLVARSCDGTPLDILNRLRHIRDYAHVKGFSAHINPAAVTEALKLLSSEQFDQESTNTRAPIPSEVRREVWRRDHGKCARCGSRENLEYDHIIPRAKGGSNTARNIELLCEACNRAKSDSID